MIWVYFSLGAHLSSPTACSNTDCTPGKPTDASVWSEPPPRGGGADRQGHTEVADGRVDTSQHNSRDVGRVLPLG